ncbi:type II CRISPR-associated endonuclease Cas1 [Eggerthia catenaformis]|uniref:type II CRISPR-associated endonuclease Cas1 n=1 Tax=Eggerthia catenaformis TaxID=31973 RepID=UPI003C6EE889
MSWRTVVISSSAKLDLQMGYLCVRKSELIKIHLSEISIIIIESTSVSLTVALLAECSKKKIKIVFCDENRNPSSELVPYYGSHDTSSKLKKQVEWTYHQKIMIWTEIVREKIKNQAIHLHKLRLKEADILFNYLSEIELGDVTNREGHAAKVYFNALFGKDFSRSSDISINAALNYGYSIILSAVNREIVSNGYITQLGLFHDNMFNQFNLGCDLMEPFRPLVDEVVKKDMPQCFEKEEKHRMLKILDKKVQISNRQEYVSNAIKLYCKSIFDALNEKDTSLIKFYIYEL